MYVKKEIREFIEKMPKKEKLTREWKKFIQESTIKHNLLICLLYTSDAADE